MLYFVPAWYDNHADWDFLGDTLRRPFRAEGYDDTVSQYRIFSKEEPCTLLTLCYAPQLRRFLNRQGMGGVKVWNLFDELQGLKNAAARGLGWEDFIWPEDLEWDWLPSCIVGSHGGERSVIVDMNHEGCLAGLEYYQDGKSIGGYFIDDRGFISAGETYPEGKEKVREYYGKGGICRLRNPGGKAPGALFLPDGEKGPQYSGLLERYIRERLIRLLAGFTEEDTLVIAACEQNVAALAGMETRARRVLTFFGSRYSPAMLKPEQDLKNISFAVVDTQKKKDLLPHGFPVLVMPPVNTVLQPGHSHRMRNQNLLVPVGGLEEEQICRLLRQLSACTPRIANPVVQLVADSPRTQWRTEQLLNRLFAEEQLEGLHYCRTDGTARGENDPEDEEENVLVLTAASEQENGRLTEEARIIVDLRPEPDLYLQLAGIGVGIPQINRADTGYLTYGKNGALVETDEDLRSALLQYLEKLADWNRALAFNVEQTRRYAGAELVRRWKEYREAVHE